MENLILSLNVVTPLFLAMAIGYFIKQIKIIDDHSLAVMNGVCFRIFLPTLLFYNIYSTDLKAVLNGRLMIYSLGTLAVALGVLFVLIPLLEKENRRRGVLIQGIFRGNFVLFGIPVAQALAPPEQVGVAALIIAITVPLNNAISVVVLEVFRGGRVDAPRIARGVVTNPNIVGSALGLLLLVAGIKLPYPAEKIALDFSRVATPLALMLLGGSMSFRTVGGAIRPIVIGVLGKLVILPMVFLPLSIWMGYRDIELITLMVLYGAPAAVASYTMAQQMEADGDLAAQLVVFGSAFSVLTMFIMIFSLKQLGFI
jgi:hypothetical protein